MSRLFCSLTPTSTSHIANVALFARALVPARQVLTVDILANALVVAGCALVNILAIALVSDAHVLKATIAATFEGADVILAIGKGVTLVHARGTLV